MWSRSCKQHIVMRYTENKPEFLNLFFFHLSHAGYANIGGENSTFVKLRFCSSLATNKKVNKLTGGDAVNATAIQHGSAPRPAGPLESFLSILLLRGMDAFSCTAITWWLQAPLMQKLESRCKFCGGPAEKERNSSIQTCYNSPNMQAAALSIHFHLIGVLSFPE